MSQRPKEELQAFNKRVEGFADKVQVNIVTWNAREGCGQVSCNVMQVGVTVNISVDMSLTERKKRGKQDD